MKADILRFLNDTKQASANMRLFYLYGSDDTLKQAIMDRIVQNISQEEADSVLNDGGAGATVDMMRFDQKEFIKNKQHILDDCQSFGLFSNKKILIITQVTDSFKSHLKDVEIVPDDVKIILCQQDGGTYRQLSKLLTPYKHSAVLACYALKNTAQKQFVQHYLTMRNKRIDGDALSLLVDMQGDHFLDLENDVVKLAILTKPGGSISLEQVNACAVDRSVTNMDELFFSILRGYLGNGQSEVKMRAFLAQLDEQEDKLRHQDIEPIASARILARYIKAFYQDQETKSPSRFVPFDKKQSYNAALAQKFDFSILFEHINQLEYQQKSLQMPDVNLNLAQLLKSRIEREILL